MAAGSAPEYWDGDDDDDDDDDAAVVTAASSSSPSRRSSLRDGHHFQELHQYLLSEEAAAGRTTTLPPLEESSDGAPVVVATTHKLSDHSRAIPDLNSSCLCHDHGSLTLPSNFLDWEDDNSQLDIEDEEEIPHTHAELLRPEIEHRKDETDGSRDAVAFGRSKNAISSQITFMEMVGNIKLNDAETLLTCPTITDETPDLVTETGLGIPSASNSTVGPSPLGGDHLGTAPQIGMPSHVGPSELSSGSQILDRDNLEAIDVGLEESKLSLTISNHSESSSCSDGGLERSRLSTQGEADVTSNVTLLAEAEAVAGQNEETILSLKIRVKELETQLQDRTEWAQQKVMQAARRLSKDLAELKALRQAREEMLRLKKDQKALEDSTMKKLAEMESALKKASGQADRANAAVRRLENENAEVRAEMEAAKLNSAESIATCQEVAKREKKSLKRVQAWEKQKVKLQEDLSEERRKLTQMQQQLAQAKERQQQAEVRWRQEEKAKEEAVLRADNEKRSREQADAAAKRKEESMRRKAEADKQRHRDDIQRLEQEITGLRVSVESSHLVTSRWGPAVVPLTNASGRLGLKEMNERLLRELAELQDLSHRDVRRERECVMCMCEEMSVVFLPCAHQVVCTKCNELHEKQGMQDCPSCRTPIQQRIRVYGTSS